jgi:uncharacterized membrane protein YfcA
MSNGPVEPKGFAKLAEGTTSVVVFIIVVAGSVLWFFRSLAAEGVPDLAPLAALVAAIPVGGAVGMYIRSKI